MTASHRQLADDLAAMAWPGRLRRQQAEALDALAGTWHDGGRRAWLALPPGAGKTLVGLEAARRLGRRTVIFGPNTAIQVQWISEWAAFTPAQVPISGDRSLRTPLTALTYQSLAVFDPDAEVDEDGHETIAAAGPLRGSGLLARLHANGRSLVDALHYAGPITLVLDEAHHLLEIWGALLAELLDLLPDAYVIGLTATPPQTLTADQAEQVDRLFGHPIYQASVPGLVRDGHLAPFAELAYLVTPTPAEEDWLHSEAERFAELRTDLTEPGFANVGLFEWLDARLVTRSGEHGSRISWTHLEKTRPDLARAALRLHVAGLLGRPDDARIREEHRRELTPEDWVAVLDDYLRGFLQRSGDPLDQHAAERIRLALPSLGYRVTKQGIRAGRSQVDRVLARSEAKTHAAVEIAAWVAATLDSKLRVLVLCDHEHASATLPARLVGVLDPDAGSARLMLENLAADPRTATLNPMLITGRTVAAPGATAREFASWAAGAIDLEPIDPITTGIVPISGSWTSRAWVRLVTQYFESGHCQALVGTRGLLGEGWNAPSVNTLIDLTTATTPTAVVQTRGRALRTDPDWPDKVATNWSVVCVSEEHPGGSADWNRFARKHTGYLAVDHAGQIIDGVAHVDDQFSPYAPPASTGFDAVNARMLERSTDLGRIRATWRVGEPYDDRFVHELRIRTQRSGHQRTELAAHPAPTAPSVVPAQRGVLPSTTLDGRRRHAFDERLAKPNMAAVMGALLGTSGVVGAIASTAGGSVATVLALPAALLAAGLTYRNSQAASAGRLLADAAAQPADLESIARAVADGLKLASLSPVGSESLRIQLDPDGVYRAAMGGVSADVSQKFVTALDEALSPIASPRYVIPRYVLPQPANLRRAGRRLLNGTSEPNSAVYHAVPSALGVNAKHARYFEQAWARWVSSATALYTGSPEGAGVLAAQRGLDPFDVTTLLRVAWT